MGTRALRERHRRHRAKAVRRAQLWHPDSWLARDERPSPGRIFRDHVGLDATAEVIEADLEASYVETLWHPGT